MQLDLNLLQKEYDKLSQELVNLTKRGLDQKALKETSRQLSSLTELINKLKRKEEITQIIKENESLLKSEKDEDFKKIIREEIEKLEKEREKLEEEIKEITSQKKSVNEVLVEIRAGVGGEEASLFVKELFEMYLKFSQKKGWSLTVLACAPTDLGGFKEISFKVRGKNVGNFLKYEAGVHRVQRIPETEKSGRIHTSTVAVSVLEEPKEKEIEINPGDLRIDVYRASGPGGQYVNRRESAVRITHLPTGIMVASQSARTQIQNRENAFDILKARLYQLKKEQEEETRKKERKTQIGKAKRAEKIRTYNFPQDRITDHRIKKSWKNIEKILAGNLDLLKV